MIKNTNDCYLPITICLLIFLLYELNETYWYIFSTSDLKEDSIPNAVSPAPQQNTPELLRAILNVNPNIFDQQQQQGNHWNNHLPKYNGMSPTYNYASPGAIHSSPSSHVSSMHSSMQIQQNLAGPCQSSPHVNMASPPSQSRPENQLPMQNNMSPLWSNANSSNNFPNMADNNYGGAIVEKAMYPNSQNGGFYNSLVNEANTYTLGTTMNQDMDPLAMSPQNQADKPNIIIQQGK